MKRRLALLLVFLMMFSLFSMAAYGVEISEKKVTLYYPNGDWSLTPIEAKLSFLDESDLYLKALQQLTDPKSLPAGCYDEFPESFKVEGVRIEKNAAYVIISEAAFVDSGLSNSWLTTLEEIISYNLFNLNKEIDNIKFFSSSKATKSINSIKKSDLFSAPEVDEIKDIPTLELNVDVLKGLSKKERNEAIQEAIDKALGSRSIDASEYTVCIDPGHGGSDGGASYGGLLEKNLNLKIALATRDYLEDVSWPTFEVIMTRTTDVSRTLSYRHDLANNNNADIFISIHCNATSDTSRRGVTARYPNNHDVSDSTNLANACIRGVYNYSSIPKFSDAAYQNLQVLRNSTMPATLVECGFMSNSRDLTALNSEDEDIGYGIGISANYFCQASL